MSISADSTSDETLNRGPLALLLHRQYEFPSGINLVQFSIFTQYKISNHCIILAFSWHQKCWYCLEQFDLQQLRNLVILEASDSACSAALHFSCFASVSIVLMAQSLYDLRQWKFSMKMNTSHSTLNCPKSIEMQKQILLVMWCVCSMSGEAQNGIYMQKCSHGLKMKYANFTLIGIKFWGLEVFLNWIHSKPK